ncbi:MAG: leucine-rich repeat domain-containing protein, partial [Bacteroidales bacterium]|nr:leucine-rich repeat domain-containing protein [Bacteroidales bacterium]
MTSIIISESVISIGREAFKNCSGLIGELTIPNSVTSIGVDAFSGCSGLETVTIGYSVENIAVSVFENCIGLTTVNYNATNCTYMGSLDWPAFYGCTSLATLSIGENVNSIPNNAFYGCTGISEIHTRANTPPVLGSDVFSSDILSTATVWTPCQADEVYRNADGWNLFSDIQNDTSVNFVVDIQSANDDMGSVTGEGTFSCETEANIAATANEHYHFVQWNDGNTDNPRNIVVTSDTTYTATFAIDRHTIAAVSNNTTKGAVSGGGTFDYGDEIEISAIANEGYRFLSWNDNNTDNPRTITVSGDTLYIATFEVDDTPQPVYVTIADTACGSYTWNEQTYTESGEYYQTFTAANSSDSIVRLELVVIPVPEPEISIEGVLDTCHPET